MQAFHIYVCVIFITAVANYLPNRILRHCHWMDLFKKDKYNMYDMFSVLIRNSEQFDQNLHHFTIFNISFWRIRNRKFKVI